MSKAKVNKSLRARIIRHLRKWHRRLGIWAAAFLIFLSLTGVALNHTNAFGLAHQYITNNWLLNQYAIKNPSNIQAYHQGQIVITDQFVWLNQHLLLEDSNRVIAAGKFKYFWLVLTTEQLSLFNEQGQLVDQLDGLLGLPENIMNLAISGQSIMVNTPSGYYQSDNDLMEWQPISTLVEPNWINEYPLSISEIAVMNARYRSQFLTLERVIVDAHSGRLFGDFGIFFMDLVAFSLVLLSVSGIYIWVRYSRTKR